MPKPDAEKQNRVAILSTWTGALTLAGLIGVVFAAATFALELLFGTKQFEVCLFFAVVGAAALNLAAMMRTDRKIAGDVPNKAEFAKLLREPLFWMCVSLAVLGGAAWIAQNVPQSQSYGLASHLEGQKWLFGLLMVAAFVPPIWTAYKVEQAIVRKEAKTFWRDDIFSTGSLWFGAGVLILVGLLAWGAGRSAFNQMSGNAGSIALLILIVVFIAFIVLTSVTSGYHTFRERKERSAKAAAGGVPGGMTQMANAIDCFLVRVIAPIAGSTLAKQGAHGVGLHYIPLIAVMSLLTGLGVVLPKPRGLLPIALAFLIALSVGRRWAWVEADRETASRLKSTSDKEVHVGFSNDLRDEALLSYLFLFALVPLTLFQVNDITQAFCYSNMAEKPSCDASHASITAWFSFFGLEMLKAVPFVDWAEIYGWGTQDPLLADPKFPIRSKHLIFASRVLVDFVIMAALFQAIAILQRSVTQRKLYDAGQIDLFDPILEEQFFERGMRQIESADIAEWMKSYPDNPVVNIGTKSQPRYFTARPDFEKRVAAHVSAKDQRKPPVPYDYDRLNLLLDDERDDLAAGSLWMINRFKILVGDFRTQVKRLRDNWAETDFRALSDADVRRQKILFEALLNQAFEDPSLMTDAEIDPILDMLKRVKQIDIYEQLARLTVKVLGKRRTEKTILALGLFVMSEPMRLQDTDLAQRFESKIGAPQPNLNFGLAERRNEAYEKLWEMGLDWAPSQPGAINDLLKIFDICAIRDGSSVSRQFATSCASEIRQKIEEMNAIVQFLLWLNRPA